MHPSLSPPFSSKKAPFSNQRALHLIKRALYLTERALCLTRRDSPGLCTGCSTRSLVLHPSNLISHVFQYHRLFLSHGHTQGVVFKMTVGYDGRGRSSIAFQKSLKFCQKSPIFVLNKPFIVSICLLARCFWAGTHSLLHTYMHQRLQKNCLVCTTLSHTISFTYSHTHGGLQQKDDLA